MNYMSKSKEERLEIILNAIEHAYENERENDDQDFSYESLMYHIEMSYIQPAEADAGYYYTDVKNILKHTLEKPLQ